MQGDSLPDKIRYMESQRTKMGRSRRSKNWWSPGQEGDRVATADLEDVTWADLSIGRPMIPSESRGASRCGFLFYVKDKGGGLCSRVDVFRLMMMMNTDLYACSTMRLPDSVRNAASVSFIPCRMCDMHCSPPSSKKASCTTSKYSKINKNIFFYKSLIKS